MKREKTQGLWLCVNGAGGGGEVRQNQETFFYVFKIGERAFLFQFGYVEKRAMQPSGRWQAADCRGRQWVDKVTCTAGRRPAAT